MEKIAIQHRKGHPEATQKVPPLEETLGGIAVKIAQELRYNYGMTDPQIRKTVAVLATLVI